MLLLIRVLISLHYLLGGPQRKFIGVVSACTLVLTTSSKTVPLARKLEEHADEVVAAYLAGIRSGDPNRAYRAAEAWISRVHGRPKETVETVSAPDDPLGVLFESSEHLREGEGLDEIAATGILKTRWKRAKSEPLAGAR